MEDWQKQLIKGFNLERFIEWQNRFYTGLSEAAVKEIEEKDKEALEEWEAFLKNTEDVPAKANNTWEAIYSADTENEIEQQRQIEGQKEVFKRIQTPVAGELKFSTITNAAQSSAKQEIRDTEQNVALAIVPAKDILVKRLTKAKELIDFELLEWCAGPRPLVDGKVWEALSTFSEVEVCKWIFQQMETIEAGDNETGTEVAKTPLHSKKWNTDKIIYALNRIGFFELEEIRNMTILGKYELISKLTGIGATNVRLSCSAFAAKTARHDPKKYRAEFEEWLKERKIQTE